MSRFRNATVLAFAIAVAAPAFVFAQQQKPSAPAKVEKAAAPVRSAPLNLGRPALPAEIAAWDIDVRPDGTGLPPGRGSVKQGEEIFLERCAACHGEFGEGAGRWPVLAGGRGSLKSENPEKTLGSFWPDLSTAWDYIFRAMPFGNGQSLTPDETYAVVAYLLNLNDVVKDDFELSKENFTSVKLPNVDNFYDDDRETSEKAFWNKNPCMTNCKPDPAKVTGRARVIDVTPDHKTGPRVE
jgi:mono/diheme cytochrome c family protein